MKPVSSERSAVSAAVSLLSRRDHGQNELRLKLRLRGYAEEEIRHALERSIDWGYLDDVRFVLSFLRYRSAKGYGPRRIVAELKERGVDIGDINLAMAEAEQDWFSLCSQCCHKKYGLQHPVDFKARSKIYRYLTYRGFEPEQIQFAIEQME